MINKSLFYLEDIYLDDTYTGNQRNMLEIFWNIFGKKNPQWGKPIALQMLVEGYQLCLLIVCIFSQYKSVYKSSAALLISATASLFILNFIHHKQTRKDSCRWNCSSAWFYNK